MRLYVANTTKQDHQFVYRVPESTKLHQQTVMSGQQVQIYKDEGGPVIDAIIKQHECYGLVRVDEIDRTKPFIGLCYSIDREITVSKIMYAAEHNDDFLIERALHGRTEAAAALGDKLSRSTDGSLNNLEVEVVEARKPGDTTPGFRQTIQVPKTAAGNGAVKAQRGRRPRSA